MAYILIGGHQFPIASSAPVTTYDTAPQGQFSFYDWLTFIENKWGASKPEKVAFLKTIRPKGRLWSKRWSKLRAEPQLGPVSAEDLELLGERVIQVVLHHDAAKTANVCYDVLVGRGLSTHFIINWDGKLHQVLDVYDSAWATGANNPFCIGIDLNNPVMVSAQATDPAKPPRQIFSGRINGKKRVGMGYTDAQYATLVALLKVFKDAKIPGHPEGKLVFPALAARFFPPYDAEGAVSQRLIAGKTKFVGFMGHWHCSAAKWDPGPGFEWDRVVAGIHGDKNAFPINLAGAAPPPLPSSEKKTKKKGDKPKKAPVDSAIDVSAEGARIYYENIEGDDNGGWYPIGAGQSWHSGVHLHGSEGQSVFNMIEGEIMAVRNTKRTELGDPSFVLVRHDFAPEEDAKEPVVPYYSLFMHLKQLYKPDVMGSIPWMNELLNGTFEPPEEELFGDDGGRPKHLQQPSSVEADAKFKKNDYKAFWDGDIILCQIPVKAGEIIGQMGVFGTSEWTIEPLIHCEVFAAHVIDKEVNFGNIIKVAGSDWIVVEADPGNTNLIAVDTRQIIEPIMEATGVQQKGNQQRVLKTSDIQEFFADSLNIGDITDFRKMITLHKSEWSRTIDWRETAAHAVGWSWQTQQAFAHFLASWFPFMWLDDTVSEWCGITLGDTPEATHRFWCYHPIYLLSFLSKNYSVTVKDKEVEEASDNELETEKERELAEAKANKARISELLAKQSAGEKLTPEEDEELLELISQGDREGDDYDEGDPAGLYENLPEFTKWDAGEWEVPK